MKDAIGGMQVEARLQPKRLSQAQQDMLKGVADRALPLDDEDDDDMT